MAYNIDPGGKGKKKRKVGIDEKRRLESKPMNKKKTIKRIIRMLKDEGAPQEV